MNIDTRNKIVSLVLGIVIIALTWVLYDSIITPYQEVLDREEMTERVRTKMSTIRDVLIQYELEYGKFPPAEGGLDSVIFYLQNDPEMIALHDSILVDNGTRYSPDQIVFSPRDNQRFLYSVNDTLRPPLYLLEDPSEEFEDAIGSLSRTTMRNAPNWN